MDVSGGWRGQVRGRPEYKQVSSGMMKGRGHLKLGGKPPGPGRSRTMRIMDDLAWLGLSQVVQVGLGGS